MGLAINPPTPIESLLPFIPRVSEVLIMTVNPGFSGQKYIYAMESRLRLLRSKFPKLTIEVDGGVNLETIHHAYQNGANYLAAASAIFSGTDIGSNIVALKKRAIGDAGG